MKIPYGNADFANIRRSGMFYVDKTPFLPELENAELGYKNLVFLRPRRFGKSSLVSMMEHYYDLTRADEFDELFGGLWIHDHPTPEKNKHLVLSLNFSRVATDQGFDTLVYSFWRAVRDPVAGFIERHAKLVPMLSAEAERLDDIRTADGLIGAVMTAAKAAGHTLYVLIDEYDTFANALLSTEQRDIYSQVTNKGGFVRAFYRILKTGSDTGAIARTFITGATPILLDDLTTGFNVATNISVEPRFNALAGFTEADVTRAIDELLMARPKLASIAGIGNRGQLLRLLERFYNGYRFSEDAEERVFNSSMVLYFFQRLTSRGKMPTDMLDPNARTDYRKLHQLWMATGPAAQERRAVLEKVLDEGHVWSELVEHFGVSTASTTNQFVSLMYYTGMLTLSPEPPDVKEYRFEPPNRVIRELAWEHYTRLLEDLEGLSLTDHPVGMGLRAMAREGDIAPFIEVFRKNVLSVLGLKDLRQYNERSMKMLLMGTILMSGIFHVLSEKEFAQGYNDLFLSPMPNVRNAKFAWMLELKYLTAADKGKLDATVADAEAQLRRYLADQHLVPMLAKGMQVRAGTLVFIGGKEVEWRQLATENA